jgi:aryl-alcohol dehydrogenase-like predicted oxidoreductase
VIGRWIRQGGRRSQLVIATKVGNDMGDGRIGLTPSASARRWRPRCAGCTWNASTCTRRTATTRPRRSRATLEAFGSWSPKGKVRAIGASNYTAPRLRRALETSRGSACRATRACSPCTTCTTASSFEEDLQGLCRREHVGVINYYALAAGFLTGKYRSRRGRRQEPARPDGGAEVPRCARPAHRAGARTRPPTQRRHAGAGGGRLGDAQPAVTSPIASATSLAQLEELVKAAELRLDAATVALLDEASGPH